MSETQLTVYPPQEEETLEDYFRRYTDEELRIILSHPQKSVELCSALLNTHQYVLSEPTNELQRLWDQMKYLNNYGHLKHSVQRLKYVRLKLVKSLAETAYHIEQNTKYASILRLISSAGDIVGTVGGLWMRESTFDYSNEAFRAAAAFGFLGTVSTITELCLSTTEFVDVMKQLKDDQTLFTPIQQWFQQSAMLHEAMLDVFPPDIAQDIIKCIGEIADTQFRGKDVLVKLFKLVAEKDIELIRNDKLIKNMLTVFSHSNIVDLIQWMIFQHCPIYWDISKMVLQMQYSPLKLVMGQYLPALPKDYQNLWSIPVWARIALNCGTMFEAFRTLRRTEISALASEMKQLHTVFEQELAALDRIIQHADSRRNGP